MIAFLKGTIIAVDASTLIIQSGNIGWSVNASNAIEYLIGQEVSLFIHTNVRETEISLWGFRTLEELSFFKLLLNVSGIGPKTALTLVEQRGVSSLALSIITGDSDGLKVSGVGSKTAQKIVIELKNKVERFVNSKPISGMKDNEGNKRVSEDVYAEAMEALVALGYRTVDVAEAIKKIVSESTENFESSQGLIKKVLKVL